RYAGRARRNVEGGLRPSLRDAVDHRAAPPRVLPQGKDRFESVISTWEPGEELLREAVRLGARLCSHGSSRRLVLPIGRNAQREPDSGRFDVVVVGSGPAGATAACVLARGGARVALVDKATFQRAKAGG